MSNTNLKLILVILLTVILSPLFLMILISIIFTMFGSFMLPIYWLVFILPGYLLCKFLIKKNKKKFSLPKEPLEKFLDRILKLYLILLPLSIVSFAPSMIVNHPVRMMFIFIFVLPICALYLKVSSKPEPKTNVYISNFKG